MKWPALEIQLPAITHDPNLIELLFARLDDFQPTAIQEDDARVLRVFFSSSSARNTALDAVIAAFADRGMSARPVDVDDENWTVRSQARLRSVEVGDFVVAPPWDVPTAVPPKTRIIVIEPSMGFGTGHHASTRLCLKALQTLDLRGRRVLDVGTGSGVLAIAATFLGAERVFAVDVDADALDSARENAARNGVAGKIAFKLGDFRSVRLPTSDVVLANLTGALMNATLERLIELTSPEGVLVLSGFTHEELVARPDGPVASSPHMRVMERLDEEGWRCFLLQRSNEQ